MEPFVIYAPNTFIPDGDGVNDIFNVVTDFEMIEWELKIFNRWGEMVHRSDIIENGWDGTYKGVVCPDGIYTYVFTIKVVQTLIPQSKKWIC